MSRSRARAAVGSPPGQCRQSNYPSASPPLTLAVSLSSFLSLSLALALSRYPRSHRVSLSLFLPLFLSLFPPLLLPSSLSLHLHRPVVLSSLPLFRTRALSRTILLASLTVSSLVHLTSRSPPRHPLLRFQPMDYSLLLDRSEPLSSSIWPTSPFFLPVRVRAF